MGWTKTQGEFMKRTRVKRHKRKTKKGRTTVKKHRRKVKKKKEGINLKDPSKHEFGSVEWQEVMGDNILEKMRHNEPLGPAEISFVKIQEEKYGP